MFGVGQWELFIILLVILLVFGAKRIPDMAQGLGKGIREFRKAMRDVQSEIEVDGTSRATTHQQQVEAAAPPQSLPQQTVQPAQPATPPAQAAAADASANSHRL